MAVGAAVVAVVWFAVQAFAQSTTTCATTVSGSVAAPSVASGFEARLVATGLTSPRAITFDSSGHLLVVQQGVGVQALTLSDAGGVCVTSAASHVVVKDPNLNHGITLSHDGRTLYASSPESVFRYAYDPSTATANGNTTIVTNMTTSDHTTRPLLLSTKQNGTLIVMRGSTANLDPEAEQLTSGHSQIKAFNLSNQTATYDFDTDGQLLGWGMRNDVGVDEHPITGGIYSVENSADDITRMGVDVHENNPGEEMNYLGTLINNSSPNQGGNFGYPECFSAWNVSELPNNAAIQVGTQFAIGPNVAGNDTICRNERVAARLVFQAHMAPLDILFNTDGSEAWITWHGSWDRNVPVGYKISAIQFANGEPVEPSTSLTAAIDVVANQNPSQCPNGCFRPVGLAWDSQGRLFFSSDSTGEIYVISRTTSTTSAGSSGSGTSSGSPIVSSRSSSASATASSTSSAGSVDGALVTSTTTMAVMTATPAGSAAKQIGECLGLAWLAAFAISLVFL